MHSYASIHIHLHSTALTTIWSVWGFQQTVPSQFLMIQNGKIITSTEPKPSARTGIISKSSVQTGIFSKSNFWKTEFRLGFLFKLFSFDDCKHPKFSLTLLTFPSIITFRFSGTHEGQNGHFPRLNLAESPKFHSWASKFLYLGSETSSNCKISKSSFWTKS